jgi:hypothetical protein
VYWVGLAQNRDKWKAPVNSVMATLRVSRSSPPSFQLNSLPIHFSLILLVDAA